MESSLSPDIRTSVIRKILREYTALFAMSPQDQLITKGNLEAMDDLGLEKEMHILENFYKKVDMVAENGAIKVISLKETEEKESVTLDEQLFSYS